MGARGFPEPSQDFRAPSSGRSPRTLLQKLVGPLVVYHALVLGGALLIVVAGSWGLWRFVGVALVVLGISVEVAILAWSASLARSASARPAAPSARSERSPIPARRRVCVACGRAANDDAPMCPRCGRVTVFVGRVE